MPDGVVIIDGPPHMPSSSKAIALPGIDRSPSRLRTDREIAERQHPGQVYKVGDATVRFGGRDPDIFDRVNQLATLLLAMAKELQSLSQKNDDTWNLVRRMKALAMDLETHIEQRKG